MGYKRITLNFNERFAAPLPEFYKRRIVFWQDEDREVETMLDELEIPDVKIIKLTGTNNFCLLYTSRSAAAWRSCLPLVSRKRRSPRPQRP